MRTLHLMGVSEDGEHLLLDDEEGATYLLAVDDALRAGVTTAAGPGVPAPEPSAPRAEVPPRQRTPRVSAPLTPRDIQARIRAGASVEQVAEEHGVDLASVQRYESPVRAERDYVAYLAQRVEVSSALPSHDGYRSASGDDPALLGDMVEYRLRSFGVDQGTVEWDSWRLPDGSWHVEASFELPEGSALDLGEHPPAQWTYNASRKTVVNGNRWAQVLSELEALDGPLSTRRLSAVADRVFDVEAEQDHRQDPTPDTTQQPAQDTASDTVRARTPSREDQDGLLDVLRSRRGQRLGADEEGDDALAELLTRGGIPAAHPRPDESAADSGPDGLRSLSLAPQAEDDPVEESPRHDDGTVHLPEGIGIETHEVSVVVAPIRPARPPAGQPATDGSSEEVSGTNSGTPSEPGTEGGRGAEKPEPTPDRRVKPKRSSVPSWDDIVFGRKGE